MASVLLERVSVDFALADARNATSNSTAKSVLSIGGDIRSAHGHLGVAAVRNVNITLENGDRLGLIGHNGAGKTTLLRVIAGILPPTEGLVRIEGRVSALLSIHLGLNQEASGYENIVNRARLMGYSDSDIAERQAEIADFSELGEYLHLPMKIYSSGMRLRLAFAISTAFEPDILILDEWLSAGDETFRDKAADRLGSLIERTGIVVFASHSDVLQRRVCNRGIVLSHGEVAFSGPIEDALEFKKMLRG